MKSPASSIPPHGKNIPAVVKGERRMAFAPEPLSSLPAPDWGRLVPALGNASRAVGALRSIRNLLPNSDYFLEGCVKREALYSSQVEGTQSSLDDLLLDEDGQRKSADGGNSPDDDRAETSNYVTALKSGLDHLRGGAPDSLPLSLRLLRNLHQTLLQSGRGSHKSPGEFRSGQNWIGNYIHIPPPPHQAAQCMAELETFIVQPDGALNDPLIRAGMAHAQFETIHPFLDGNGRMGRLLIVLMLINEGALDDPWLYVSLPIKKSRQEYHERLQSTRATGDWTAWLLYFLRVVAEAAGDAEKTAREANALFLRDREKIKNEIGAQSPAPTAVHQALQRFPIASMLQLAKQSGFSQPAVKSALDRLIQTGVVRPYDDRLWRKRFVYHEYMEILRRDGEPL